VTHDHRDHNRVDLCPQAAGCRVITSRDALAGGMHNSFDVGGVAVEAVEAGNLMHSPKRCVGYVIDVDGVRLYVSGDTSKTAQMSQLANRSIDYAFFCGDGLFNMGPRQAADCARLVGARHNILYHVRPGALFDDKKARDWTAPNKLVVEPGQEIDLVAG
jgi:L-ascorbate metabolism protein UlaG (beta-lactamase superfamily)